MTAHNARCSDQEFIKLFETLGGNQTAIRLHVDPRNVYERRAKLEKKYRRQIVSPNSKNGGTRVGIKHPAWLEETVESGTVIVGSDAHYWPDIVTTAHKGFVKFCKEIKPKVVVMNGDVLDGATISRHSPIGWEDRPALSQEIEACQERLGEIEFAAGKAKKIWTLGNHDGRFETKLATVAPEYANVHGKHLKDFFPLWEPCWSVNVNGNTVIKHRMKGGAHATYNNTMHAGMTMVTGHLHALQVRPFTDYNGTRYGVDTGTLAEPYGPMFEDYTEQSPLNWRSGFVVLTFHKGKLLQPQLAMVIDEGKIDYCGKVYEV